VQSVVVKLNAGEAGVHLEGRDDQNQLLLRALSHPLRVKMLRVLSEQVASPSMMSKMLREPLGSVAYHATVLLEYDCIEEVRQRPRRGATEHFYRAKPNSSLGSLNWQQIPAALKGDLAGVSLDSFTDHVLAAVEKGAFKQSNESFFSWHPLTVDARGQQELRDLLQEVAASFEVVADRSRRRLGKEDGTSLLVAVAAIEASREAAEDAT
jgi:DNA-binding transcriptional ArsR family regulator